MNRKKNWTDTLTRPFEVKADSLRIETKADGSRVGRFSGYLSVFGNQDSYDDIVEPGAFKRTLSHRKGRFPLAWFHDLYTPIGIFMGKEDEKGLFIDGFINLETAKGAEVYSGMKFEVEEMGGDAAYITEMSIGYNAVQSETDDKGVRHLQEVALREGSLLPMYTAANEDAQITSKADGERITPADAKALRDVRERFEKAFDDVTELLASVSVCEDAAPSEAVKSRIDAVIGMLPVPEPPAPEAPAEVDTAGIGDILEAARATLAG